MEGEKELKDVRVSLCCGKHLKDPSLTYCILKLLILNEELLFHDLHRHQQARVTMLNFEDSPKGAFTDRLKNIEVLELWSVELPLFEKPEHHIVAGACHP